MKPFTGTAAVGVALALLAACTAGVTAPSPSPTPTAATTPAETPLERQTRLDYSAAEKAYRTWNAEYNRIMRDGGATKPTAVMTQTLAGPYLKELTQLVEGFKKNGGRQVGSLRIGLLNQAGYSEAEILLSICENARDVVYYKNGKKFGKGSVRTGILTVRKIGISWKIWSSKGEEADAC